jgi:hypothetical protein
MRGISQISDKITNELSLKLGAFWRNLPGKTLGIAGGGDPNFSFGL